MEILNLYTSLLAAGHMCPDEAGVIHRQIKGLEDKKTPVLVKLANNERAAMVMPIKSQTDLPDWDHRVVFHPLRENTQRGESLVMERYRINMLDRINSSAMVLMVTLLKLAADATLQTELSPDQLGYLAQLPDADATALKKFNELTVKCAVTDKPLWAFIKHSGMKDGVIYRRMCSVRAPMLEAIENAVDRKVKGVLLRLTDVPLFKTLFGLVFPQSVTVKDGVTSSDFGFYSQGSNSVRAPTIDAFMKSVRLLAENINDLAMLFDSAQPGLADNLMFDLAWTEVFEDIDSYGPKILMIPAMPGNEGRVLNERAEAAKETVLPWEPADAPPSGFEADKAGGYKPVGTVVSAPAPSRQESRQNANPNYNGGYGNNQRTSAPAPQTSSADDAAFKASPFYLMREREKQMQYNDGGRAAYGARQSDDPAVANGYQPENSYGGRINNGYNNQREQRSYSSRGSNRY